MISPLQVSGAVRLLFQQFIIYLYLVRPLRVVQCTGFKLPVIHKSICFPPVSAAHHNRESVDYIADTITDFFLSVSPYLLAVPLSSQIRVVVINSQVNPAS